MLNDLYFKTTCNIRPHLFGPMGGLTIEGPLYMYNVHVCWQVHLSQHIHKMCYTVHVFIYMYNAWKLIFAVSYIFCLRWRRMTEVILTPA